MPKPTETIAQLLEYALMRSTHPDAHLLLVAESVLDPRAGEPLPPGATKKMPDAVAAEAITVVTRLMRRHAVRPSDVCRDAKVANAPKQYNDFHLSAPEMDASGALTRPLKGNRRIHKGIGPYVRMVRQIAGRCGMPEADMLQELGSAVSDYLAPFAVSDRTPLELLAEDLGMFGGFFGKGREGSDGEHLDVRRYFSDAARMNVEFSPAEGRMVPAPDEPYPDEGFGHAPCVPLLVRTVAVGRVRCNTFDETLDGERFPVPMGEMDAEVFEAVFLSVVPDGKGLRAVLFSEPWTVTTGDSGPHTSRPWGEGGLTDVVRGVPIYCELGFQRAGEYHAVCFDDETLRFTCSDYERHVTGLLTDIEEANREDRNPRFAYEALDAARRIEITEDSVRTLVRRTSDDKWRTLLKLLPGTPMFVGDLALPRLAHLPGGGTSDAILDRLVEALFGDERLIVKGLTEAATRRACAMDAFMAERVGGERLRRDRFRRLMRS